MTSYYVFFNEDKSVTTRQDMPIGAEQYVYITTRSTDAGILEYYAHNSMAEFYKKALVDGMLA